MTPKKVLLLRSAVLLGLLPCAYPLVAADAAAASASAATSALPPLPPKMNVPAPGPVTDAPYAPQPILPGGVVIPLYPPGSPYLKTDRAKEAEKYNMNNGAGTIGSIVNIHNPSIEFHPGSGVLNTGAVVILVAGGGHRTLNVGGEGADFVPFLASYGINSVILRNRMRVDGYDAKTDSVYDAQQAIKLVRAYAKEWKLDPNKIGMMGFSAGAELAMPAALFWKEFDEKNDVPGNPFGKISSRPDFVGVIYPGPSPFAAGRGGPPPAPPAIPKDAPPSFIVCAGWGDRVHAVWANEWFTAMLNASVPNVEMHIYARGHHPGDPVQPDEPGAPSSGGLTSRGFIAYGSWPQRYMDWMRDLGFMGKPGVETQAAKDVVANVNRPARGGGGGGRRGGGAGPAGAPVTPPATAPAATPK